MIIGIPNESKVAEKRVAITPAGVRALTKEGHTILFQAGAGSGSGFANESYVRAGAEVRTDSAQIWADSEMILKVKEPVAPELDRMHEGQILFGFLHLAADKGLRRNKFFAKQDNRTSFAYKARGFHHPRRGHQNGNRPSIRN